jgi:protocatechuate 3,4-dioxygenase beta subunit
VGRVHSGDRRVSPPHLRIADRAVALRAVKLMGRLLDAEGRAVGYEQVDVWA